MPFSPHTEADVRQMLAVIGVPSTETLFEEIPQDLRCGGLEGIPSGLCEMDVAALMGARARADGEPACFIGAGAYDHHIPAAVWQIATRGELYSAYTPYQAEASQGTLQLLYEYQSMMTALTAMDCSNASLYDGASALAEAVLMAVRSNAEQYVRVKLASRILRDEIERYRQQHQGPLLERASEHFAVLTQGSFAGLRADINEKDEPVLVGVRPNDDRVYVEGMSSGTRDQLYLSLRLASLERYMDSAEPMPFIVDDILVHFDDERSVATLGVLAELARKTQIILFTHHRRLVEQAQALEVGVPVKVHTL